MITLSRWRAMLLVVLLLATATLQLSRARTTLVSVTGTASVMQGRAVNLRNTFSLRYNWTQSDYCRVQHLLGDGLCGEVYPRVFPCSHSEYVVFQHYGCFSPYETVNLRLVARGNSGGTVAELFSVPVRVHNTDATRPVATTDHSTGALSVILPPSLTSSCSYTVVGRNSPLSLPLHGRISGESIDQPIPCGLSPRDRLIYNFTRDTEDVVLVRVDGYNHHQVPNTPYYYLLPVSTTGTHSSKPLPGAHMDIHEQSETILPPSLLPLEQLGSYAPEDLKIIFPVLDVGGVYPVHVGNRGTLDVVTFTATMLYQWKVAFRPNQTSIKNEATFDYHVTDAVGRTIGDGSLRLRLYPRTGRRPSIRKNTGMVARYGQQTTLQPSQLSFYPTNICENATFVLKKSFSFGTFVISENSSVGVNETIPASVFTNGSLQYHRNKVGHDDASLDFSLWTIGCNGLPTLVVPILVHLLPSLLQCYQGRHNSTILAPHNTAVPLSTHLLAGGSYKYSNNTILLSTTAGVLLQTDCFHNPLSNQSRFPFIHFSDLNLAACKNSNALEIGSAAVWFLPHQMTQPATITVALAAEHRLCTPYELNIKLLNLSLTDMFTSQEVTATHTPSLPTIPALVHNHPLPLSSADSVVISKMFLYVEPQGHLENRILYQLKRPPRHGLLCTIYSLQCTRSIQGFSQADIVEKHLYYKLTQPMPMDDSFLFTYSTADTDNTSVLHKFTIKATTHQHVAPTQQFWVTFNRSKPLALKFLRHMINQIKGSNIQFSVVSGLQHGVLTANGASVSSFHFQQAKGRSIVYRHNGTGDCADWMLLTAMGNNVTVTSNITIAIRHKSRQPDTLTGMKYLQDVNSFVLSTSDMSFGNSFCSEFIVFEMLQLPGYGVLSVQDEELNVTRLLQPGGIFTAADINHGLVSYTLVPDLTIFENTTDLFQMKFKIPGQKEDIRRSPSTTLNFQVVIIEEGGSGMDRNITFATNSPKWLTQLHNGKYGTIFDRNDLYEQNGEIPPHELQIIVRQQPAHGVLKLRNHPVGEFTLEHVYNGLITYESILSHEDTTITSDEFRFTVIFQEGLQVTIAKTFVLNWCYFYINSSQSTLVDESVGQTRYIIRRTGPSLSQRTYVNFTTEPVEGADSATGQSDCGSDAVIVGDFCSLNQRLHFAPGRGKLAQTVKIYNDMIAEGPERFNIKLSQPEGCLLPRQSPKRVWITDYEDYSMISFSIPQSLPHSHRRNRDLCRLEVTTEETVGVLNLNLTRAGNLNQTVGVICYTNRSLKQGRPEDFISRPNNASSMVYFRPGQQYAQCPVVIVDDDINEPTDSFYVYLGKIDGYAFIDHSSTPVCVIITHDKTDVPQVQFTTTRIIVQENKDTVETAPFTIRRIGADLTSKTEVILEAHSPAPDNATAGLDFYAGPMDKIVFESGEELKTGFVRIRPDNKQEGKEVFHIRIKDNYNGRWGSPSVLEVIILDAFEDTVISFESTNITRDETDGLIQVPFSRRGYLAVTSNITCLLTPGSATPSQDYFLLPQRITLSPNVTHGACNVLLIDDTVREGEEYFTITLHTNDLGARLVTSRATVFIADIEDIPLVSFAQTEYIIREPLSNFPVDHKEFTIALTRLGDINQSVSVVLSTRPGTAIEDVDYIAANSTLHFPAGVNNVSTTAVQVLANHKRQQDSDFYLMLSTIPISESEVRLRNNGEARIIVRHWALKGVYYPALPEIGASSSFSNSGNITFDAHLNHDNPLMCVTPCDPLYPTGQAYLAECTRQGIDRSKTRFIWETSTDGSHFMRLQQDTLFTVTQGQVLDPVYLERGLFVRCTALAVDVNGVGGYSRVSRPVQLTRIQHCPLHTIKHAATSLSSHSGFRWGSQDLVMLAIDVPHLPNTLPLVSTKQFTVKDITTFLTYPASRQDHVCSNFVLSGMPTNQHNFLSALSAFNEDSDISHTLYQHYSPGHCKWTFQTWLPLDVLQNMCGALVSKHAMSVQLNVLYFRVQNNTAISVANTSTIAVLNHSTINSTSHTIYPYEYWPVQTGLSGVYVHLISVQWDSTSSSLSAMLYSYAPDNVRFDSGTIIHKEKRRSISNSKMTLIYSDTHGKQTWLINTDMKPVHHDSRNIYLKFNLVPCIQHSRNAGCKPGPAVTFDIPLVVATTTQSTATSVVLTRTTMEANITRVNGVQQAMLVHLRLSPVQRLHAEYTLSITGAWLCSSLKDIRSQGKGCLNQTLIKEPLDVMDSNNNLNTHIETNTTHIQVQLTVDTLQQRTTDKWYIHIRYGVVKPGQAVVSEDHVVLLVPLNEPQIHLTNMTSSPSSTLLFHPQPPGSEEISIYAAVLLSLALCVLIVVCSITACFVCYSSRQRLLHMRKMERPHNDDEESSTSKPSQQPTVRPTLTNTHSRKIRRSKSSVQLLMQKAVELSWQNQAGGSIHTTPVKSKSKPSLKRSHSLSDIDTLKHCPVDSICTPSRTLSTSITSSKARVATVKPLTQTLTTPRPPLSPSNHKLTNTDMTLDAKLENWKKTHPSQPASSGAGWYERHKLRQIALASYAQLYLAAGARTPEPGVSPSTKL